MRSNQYPQFCSGKQCEPELDDQEKKLITAIGLMQSDDYERIKRFALKYLHLTVSSFHLLVARLKSIGILEDCTPGRELFIPDRVVCSRLRLSLKTQKEYEIKMDVKTE